MYSTSWYFSRMNMRDTCSFESHNPWEMLTIKKDNIMTTYEWKSWLNVCISKSVEATELLRRNDFLGDNIAIIYQPKARYIPIAWDSTIRSQHQLLPEECDLTIVLLKSNQNFFHILHRCCLNHACANTDTF